MFTNSDTVDLICDGFVRTLKSRTNSAKAMVPCGVWPALREGRGEGVWLLPASPGGWGRALFPGTPGLLTRTPLTRISSAVVRQNQADSRFSS